MNNLYLVLLLLVFLYTYSTRCKCNENFRINKKYAISDEPAFTPKRGLASAGTSVMRKNRSWYSISDEPAF